MAGLLSIHEAIYTAQLLGQAAAMCDGAMLHMRLPQAEADTWSDDALCLAARNGIDGIDENGEATLLSVTLSGPSDRVTAWLATHPDSKRLAPTHAWHHPMYLAMPSIRDGSAFATLPAHRATASNSVAFLSATTQHAGRLDAAHWVA